VEKVGGERMINSFLELELQLKPFKPLELLKPLKLLKRLCPARRNTPGRG